MNWIKVHDQLPEQDTPVIVYSKDWRGDDYIYIADLTDINKEYRDRARTRKDKWPIRLEFISNENIYNGIKNITHWMYLPEVPK